MTKSTTMSTILSATRKVLQEEGFTDQQILEGFLSANCADALTNGITPPVFSEILQNTLREYYAEYALNQLIKETKLSGETNV